MHFYNICLLSQYIIGHRSDQLSLQVFFNVIFICLTESIFGYFGILFIVIFLLLMDQEFLSGGKPDDPCFRFSAHIAKLPL